MSDPPCFVLGFALLFAMLTCGSAGVVFAALTTYLKVPPALCSSWRLVWVELLQLVPFGWTLREVWRKDQATLLVKYWHDEGTALMPEKEEQTEKTTTTELVMPRLVRAMPWLLLSGASLGIHFTSWVYSLRMTSLTHSLLFVSMGPIFINAGCWVAYATGWRHIRPTFLETMGTFVGLAGAIVMLIDVGQLSSSPAGYQKPTLAGDMLALLGAATIAIYLAVGRRLRSWMPLWIYAFGVVGFAYLTCLFLSFVIGENPSAYMVFGFLFPPFLWYALYLGAGPGVGGHTVLSYLVKYLSPLTISTAMLSEPLIGSLLGFFLGMQQVPGVLTWIGGAVLLVGLYMIIIGEQATPAAPQRQEEEQTESLQEEEQANT